MIFKTQENLINIESYWFLKFEHILTIRRFLILPNVHLGMLNRRYYN